MIKSDLLGALARGYCTDKNKHKVVDPDLVEAMAEEVLVLYAERKGRFGDYKLEETIREALNDYRCQYQDCDEGGCSIIDLLVPPDENDIQTGIKEADLLAEYIACCIDDRNKEKPSKVLEALLCGPCGNVVIGSIEEKRMLRETIQKIKEAGL